MSAAAAPIVGSKATHSARLDRLAAVAIEVGLGLARGQELLITASLDARRWCGASPSTPIGQVRPW